MQVLRFAFAIALASLSLSALGAEQRYVSANSANIRSAPDGAVVDQLKRGSQVQVYAELGSWSRINPDGQSVRWVHSSLLCATLNCWSTGSTPPARKNSKPSNLQKSSPPRNPNVAPQPRNSNTGSCFCSDRKVCVGPRGGRYCITSGGNKRYGV